MDYSAIAQPATVSRDRPGDIQYRAGTSLTMPGELATEKLHLRRASITKRLTGREKLEISFSLSAVLTHVLARPVIALDDDDRRNGRILPPRSVRYKIGTGGSPTAWFSSWGAYHLARIYKPRF
jgi:hypothetical protein